MIEWMGMEALEVGDRLVGRFDIGSEKVRNESGGTELDIWTHGLYFTYGEGLEAFFEACREFFGPPPLGEKTVIK